MDLRQFWEIVRDLAIAVVIMMLLPLFLERGVALLVEASSEQALLIRHILGVTVLIIGTFFESPALGIGLMAGGFFAAFPPVRNRQLTAFVILAVMVVALLRALIAWDKEYMETLYKD